MKIAIVDVRNVAAEKYLPLLAAQQAIECAVWILQSNARKMEEAAYNFAGKTFSDLAELAAWQPDLIDHQSCDVVFRIGGGAWRDGGYFNFDQRGLAQVYIASVSDGFVESLE